MPPHCAVCPTLVPINYLNKHIQLKHSKTSVNCTFCGIPFSSKCYAIHYILCVCDQRRKNLIRKKHKLKKCSISIKKLDAKLYSKCQVKLTKNHHSM